MIFPTANFTGAEQLQVQLKECSFYCNLQAVDLLLLKWDAAYRKLEAAEAAYEASGQKKRPQHRLGRCGCSGMHATTCSCPSRPLATGRVWLPGGKVASQALACFHAVHFEVSSLPD